MTIKQYRYYRLIIVMLIAATTSLAVNINNYAIPLIAITAGIVLMTGARRKVKGILADERDYALAGNAARHSLTIFVFILVIGMFGFMALQNNNREFSSLANLLAYLACTLMLINLAVFRFLKARESRESKSFIKNFKHYLPAILLSLAATIVLIASLRILTPEDTWICADGQWVRHGYPNTDLPTKICR